MNDYEHSEQILEHYGVKGMKWGVRKNTNSRNSKRNKRIAAALTVGAAATALALASKKSVPVSTIANTPNLNESFRAIFPKGKMISAGRNTSASTINMMVDSINR